MTVENLMPTQKGFKRVQQGMLTYGGKDQAEMTAAFWSLYLEQVITERDIGMLMALCKIARDKCGNKKDDNLTDICGWMDVASWAPHPNEGPELGSIIPATIDKGHNA